MSLSLQKLNSRQRDAVLHTEGPLLVLAGAGSGKTSTMAYRIAHLISERHMPASAILGLSFTRKAAEELKERVRDLVTKVSGPQACRGMTITTFHSLCVRILRQNAEQIGYTRNFTILDQNDQRDLIRQLLRNIRVDDRKFDPDRILFEIGQAKNRFMRPEQAEQYFLGTKKIPDDYAVVIASTFQHYQDQLRALDSMDFDDLLFRAVELLEDHEEVRNTYNLLYRQILVDEYQDTNPAQFRLLEALTHRHKNICVVGDDDQSIYAWRGADSAHILNFSNHFPTARTVTLDQNYRSTSTILDAANQVIAQNKHRHPKTLWSDKGQGEPIQQLIAEEDRAEAEIVAEEILKLAQERSEGQIRQIRRWKDFAVLYRSNPQSRLFEEALRVRQIPYKLVGALSFLDRKEIKDLLSYWRLALNHKDDASCRRVINWPARGIGRSSLEQLGSVAVSKGSSFFEALPDADRVAPRAAQAVGDFRGLVTGLRQSLEETPVEPEALANWAKSSLERIGFKKALEEECDDPTQFQKRWENVDELANAVGQIRLEQWKEDGAIPKENATAVDVLREYLARLTLNAMDEKEEKERKDKDGDGPDQVTLLTLHGAKGLEYPVVFMVGMEEGLLPHKRTIEEALDFSEERRLAYVGITRAKEKLYITRAKNRIRYGKTVPRTPSRFLEEIPKELLVTRDESLPDTQTDEGQKKHEERVSSFLSQMRAQLLKGN